MTICAKCSNYIEVQNSKFDNTSIDGMWRCKVGLIKTVNFITGVEKWAEDSKTYCQLKNQFGNCPDYAEVTQ
jgi:hypothetical protein